MQELSTEEAHIIHKMRANPFYRRMLSEIVETFNVNTGKKVEKVAEEQAEVESDDKKDA